MTAPEPTAPDGLRDTVREILGRLWCHAEGLDPDEAISDAGHTILCGTLGGLDPQALSRIDAAAGPILDALAASREAEAAAIRERDEAREEVELVRDDSVDQTRMLDSIAGRLGLAHDEGLDDAGPFLAAIERLSDALAAANARAERRAEDRTAALDKAMKRGIRAWSNKLHIPVTRMMSRALREEVHAALAEPAAETQETGTREREDGR